MENQIIKIMHNNEEISVRRDSSLKDMLGSKKLEKLSMKEWHDLLLQKDNHVSDLILKDILLHKIKKHDTSSEINNFILKGISYWFDKSTRLSLAHLVNCSETDVTFLLGDNSITLSKEEASKFLSELEVYASKCFLTTNKHLNNVT